MAFDHRADIVHDRMRELPPELRAVVPAALLELVYGSSVVGLAVLDDALRYRLVNPALARINGVEAEAHLGRRVRDVLPRGHELESVLREILDTGRPVLNTELSAESADQPATPGIFHVSYLPLVDPGGRVAGLLALLIDMSGRKRAEEREQILVEAGRVLAESLDEEVVLARLVRLVVPNLADWGAVRLLEPGGGLRAVEVVHEDPDKVEQVLDLESRFPPDPTTWHVVQTGVSSLVPEITDEMLEQAELDPEYREGVRALGLRSAMIVPLIARGRTYGVISLVSAESGRRFDADDMWLAEELGRRAATAIDNARLFAEAERARREAEEANRSKSQFLAVMSHELRTPLNAIAGYADLLLAGVPGKLDPDQEEQVRRIRRNEEQLLALINDVLDFARLEAGHVAYAFEDILVDEALAAAETATTPSIRDSRLTLVRRPCPAALSVHADPRRLQQILVNLIGNAAKFTPPGGSITLDCDAEPDSVRIHVTDTGPGIPEDRIEAVFAPFVQAETHLTRRHGGAGLGLAISRDLARAMNGDITVHSVPGQGSTFTVTLPRRATDT